MVELWGGVECTVNRVGCSYHNQLEMSGHDSRDGDLEAIAALGIRTLRYPILWELTEPEEGHPAWSWAERRLKRLRELAITPIAGLLHHGAGPSHCLLLDSDFPSSFARYAGAVAQRFPWIDLYTPINEPLTTARFSALYGLWYPHARDDRSFVQALLNQCRSIVLAMRAIRKTNSIAKLVQTEDLGKVYSKPTLRYQAEFENERRWLTWDLLCGRVDTHHRLWDYLRDSGAPEDSVLWFADNPCPPELIGINHYATSNRFLHDRPELFPERCRASNGRQEYADIEAVRAMASTTGTGIGGLLAEAWQRYRLPLAVTEAHLGCSREEQMRWLYDIWQSARQAREEGADLRAVTLWSLFGGHDWNSLLTEFRGYYEPGAFDVRGALPRPTALAGLARELTSGRTPHYAALLRMPGWWQRPSRLYEACRDDPSKTSLTSCTSPSAAGEWAAPLLIVGSGSLGHAFGQMCIVRGIPYILADRRYVDIAFKDSVAAALDELHPWAVINAAGYVAVDEAERQPDRCDRDNRLGPANLAAACSQRGLQLVTFSSDLVFDGLQGRPYVETDPVAPVNAYGRSKARAETAVLARHPGALVVRTSAFFGPWDSRNFLTVVLARLLKGAVVRVPDDVIVSPTYLPDLVNACLDLLFDKESGVWHLTNAGALSWADFAAAGATRARISKSGLSPTPWAQMGQAAPRPPNSSMSSSRGVLLPALADALDRYATSGPVST
jgi:dTDP-4-dehydrorhamnose reductase